ncbi:MAG: AAA family ATPase [Planctomycetota bacterium]|nr:AAA family ATPase [Planctomycetota bacterium]
MSPQAVEQTLETLRANIQRVYIGNSEAVDRLIRCLLARGHVLIEDVPGVGKTLLATALARSLDCSFSRIQLTPDMLPSDVLGVSVFHRDSGEFQFKKGPLFANIILADEINRTTPRTQSALLESMNEATVSIDGRVYSLEQPFMVIATQNPYEFEGTYLLPENQLDRFLMQIHLGYPRPEDEARVIEIRPSEALLHELRPVLTPRDVMEVQRRVDEVRLDRTLVEYIIALATATRRHEQLQVGLSPRGTLALAHAARAAALMAGRDYCIPEDVVDNVEPVCAHRLVSRAYLQTGDTRVSHQVLQEVLRTVPSPS